MGYEEEILGLQIHILTHVPIYDIPLPKRNSSPKEFGEALYKFGKRGSVPKKRK